jgi:hypothetical protein
MKLAALIQKNGVQPVAKANPANPAKDEQDSGATLAGLAALALANPREPKSSGLAVTVFTPLGVALTVEAKDADHAEQLRQWNPQPTASAGASL